mmetsp:Transcript_20995/g.29458  ORF Transcript_20995/g.29458 Transcript_20995/m.29458 type:complete len:89 (+) Transcript_20995:287-553(+)
MCTITLAGSLHHLDQTVHHIHRVGTFLRIRKRFIFCTMYKRGLMVIYNIVQQPAISGWLRLGSVAGALEWGFLKDSTLFCCLLVWLRM